MVKRLFRSTFIVALVVLLSSAALVITVLYGYFSDQYIAQIKNEANYIAQGIEYAGMNYFTDFTRSEKNQTRITWVDTEGNVLFDSVADPAEMKNHSDREEIQKALSAGEGFSSRYSSTLAKKTVNYAIKLSDETILRVSNIQHSIFSLLFSILQPIVVILIIAIALSFLLAYQASKRIVKPLNEINLETPEKNIIYEELQPLIERLTVQKQMIQAQMTEIQRKQQEFAAITENMSEGFLVLDQNAELLSYNSSAIRMLGTGILSGKKCTDFVVDADNRFVKAVETALAGTHNNQSLYFSDKHYQLISNPVYEADEVVGAVIIIFDATEREASEKMRREFTANVSHELKTPLTSISGFAEIIRNGIAKPEDISHFADNIYNESQRLIALVGDIIKLSRLDENVVPVPKEEVDLKEVAESVVKHLSAEAESKQVSLSLQADHAVIIGAHQLLDEMIYNLCDNAIKYNKPNGMVKIDLYPEKDTAVLIVRDTGIGIPTADQERVFERFYRVDKSHSKEIGGTGLGLSIVKHGAVFHNASITLQSELGKGTEITVRFPLK